MVTISWVLVIYVLQYLPNCMSSVMNNEVCLGVHYVCDLTQISIALGLLMQMVNSLNSVVQFIPVLFFETSSLSSVYTMWKYILIASHKFMTEYFILFFLALTAVCKLTLQEFFIKNSFKLQYIGLPGSPPVSGKRKREEKAPCQCLTSPVY